ncbi:hypothetical protein POVWA2_017150 [Plasmodium ovale wallikeri]|uniref:Uncharacterized protein n=1 Tax=Plasmodium ovale wallikeri TaxID=864142 RepID=A0A1A8YQK8_PLAOA|nr:hypothetical protein POVWA1_017270 [Plasmodium ovale wallikeri]SBT33898.1 hypothetical protein POVWA2_017150 [Plasmodium ovale wallikeri]
MHLQASSSEKKEKACGVGWGKGFPFILCHIFVTVKISFGIFQGGNSPSTSYILGTALRWMKNARQRIAKFEYSHDSIAKVQGYQLRKKIRATERTKTRRANEGIPPGLLSKKGV